MFSVSIKQTSGIKWVKMLSKTDIHWSSKLNSIQDHGGTKRLPLPVFSPITSANVETSQQNFQTFSFDPFATLV